MFPDRLRWEPMLQVRLGHAQKHAKPSPRFYAYVDSGSPYCMFKCEFATLLGINPEQGFTDEIGGIIPGSTEPIYFHKVKLHVESDWIIEITAGFMKKLTATGILGRNGFFDHFKITFDHS